MLRPTVKILRNSNEITLISDPERSEILRILNAQTMTSTQLASRLSLTRSAVGYHTSQLMKAGLIRVERTEVEAHGIMQRYFTTTATCFIVDPSKIPKRKRRRFLRTKMNQLRGFLALALILKRESSMSDLSLEFMEELAEALLQECYRVGKKNEKRTIKGQPESLDVIFLAEAFRHLLHDSHWSARLAPLFGAITSLWDSNNSLKIEVPEQ